MAIGVLGMPLKRGKTDAIDTVKMNATPAITGSKAGLVVFRENVDAVKQETVNAPDATTTLTDAYGILTTDIKADAATPTNGYMCGVIIEGHAIPVQYAGAFTDITEGIGFDASGKIVQGDSVDVVKMLNGRLCSLETYKALDENNDEVDCVIIDLYGAGSFPKRSV